MFKVLEDKDTILPAYPCGKLGRKVQVSYHGCNHAVWTLVDDFDQHVGAPRSITGKPKCQVCYDVMTGDDTSWFDKYLKAMQAVVKEAMGKVAEQLKNMVEGMNYSSAALTEFAEKARDDSESESVPADVLLDDCR